MEKVGKLVVSIGLDTTELEGQISSLQTLLDSALKDIPDHLISTFFSNLPAVLNDIVLADSSSAPGARLDVIHRVRLGAKYERFTAAIRAREFDSDSF
ncbi:hypothetical protein CHU32_08265 [Superficieibacter electus]|uniref:Uncharacterized protein n=1 Tax=Superficieibacter electus TaxID=2022662 RepID=A0A2P5GST6_9ENTR|nr:hypothetical protein [Superficieibacter electus]POP46893.1 hypothetical protein CHU33_05315 [Superficieibacter electus]POP49630.1 hypothetical protein CHU32_08265 [Superficieibacter electus]